MEQVDKVIEVLQGGAGIKPIPTSECTLTLFMTHLATHNISLATLKVYLSAVRHMHLCKGLHNHFNEQYIPRSSKHVFTLPDSAYPDASQNQKLNIKGNPPPVSIPHSGL